MTTPPVQLTPDQLAALDIARGLVSVGVPLFVAAPDPAGVGVGGTGFWLPQSWDQTAPDAAVVDRWAPGMALCAVMGHGIDLLDVDPRNGGELSALNGTTPTSYGLVLTPSGGVHSYIASLGVGSRDNIAPGLDVKGGSSDGSGRGFAFLPPTVKLSKTTGELAAYRWAQPPDLTRLASMLRGESVDGSGAKLAARIRELKTGGGVTKIGGPDWYREFLIEREPQSAPAAERAIRGKLDEVSTWAPTSGSGFRQVLLRAALTLGGYVGGGYLDEDDARERLAAAVSSVWGTPDQDDLLWIDQGLTDGQAQPFGVYTAEDELAFAAAQAGVQSEGPAAVGGAGIEPPTGPPWNIFTVLGNDPFDPHLDSSDQGLAEAVALRMYPVLRYARDAGSWIKRERDVWEELKDTDTVPNWIVSQLARLMPLGQTPVPKEVTERTEMHWQAVRRALFMSSAGTSRVARKLRALVHSDHPAALRVAHLDTNPEVLWAGGMPWDLRTSGNMPTLATWVDPNTPHLHTALCTPNPDCATPRWDAFLAAVLPDPATRSWALRVLSIALTGYADAAVPVLYGKERSGKTSLVEMIVTVLGSYAHAANPKLLSAQDNSHDAIIYDLKGRRLSFIDEGPKRDLASTERLKQLTGGGSLTAAKKYGNPITFAPTHTLVMTTNNEPQLTDPALRARMRLIPCDAPEDVVRPVRLPLLGHGLAEEAPGILAQLMRETAAYLADRDSAATSAAPLAIRGLAQEMGENQDPVREWVQNCTVPADPGTPGRQLYTRFAEWHQASALYRRSSIPTETAFGRTLTDMGYKPAKLNGLSYRPLSAFGGPGTVVVPPTPNQYMEGVTPIVPSPGGSPEGAGGSVGEPSGADNPRSTPLSLSSSGGLEGIYIKKSSGENKGEIGGVGGIESYTGESLELPSGSEETPKSPGLTCDDAPGRWGSAHPPASSEADGGTSEQIDPLHPVGLEARQSPHWPGRLGVPKQVGEPTNSEVAARAYQGQPSKQITKAEARAQLKAEARLVAIREASGEVLELPAVVDRAGNTLSVRLDQAGRTVAEAIGRSGALTVDVETSGYPIGHEHYELRSVQLGDEVAAVVLHPVTHAELIRTALGAAPRLHAHSATADLSPLAHAGLIDIEDGWARMYDTVIPAKLADPQSTGSDPGLKQLAAAVLKDASVAPAAEEARKAVFKAGRWLEDTKIDTPVERSGWAQIETGCTTMLRYAASDVLDTAALARQLPVIPSSVLERERLVQQMTARVAYHGVRIDAEHVVRMTEQHRTVRAQAAERVQAFGVENPGSNPQVAAKAAELGAELPRTSAGALSVAEGVLDPLRGAEGPLGAFVNAVLDYRHHDKVIGTYLAPYARLCERGDGRARPTIYTLGTDTGRMSCVRPNLQQLPREGGVRACITADPGQLMIGADFSGVEIRVAAALSQDPTLLQFLIDGRDLHNEIAKLVFGPDSGKAGRYKAKPMVFQRMYGGSVRGLARNNGVSEAVAQSVVDAFDKLTPQLSAWSAGISNSAKRGQTQFPSYSGRVIHLPLERAHAAPNYCIQGTARELLMDAFIRWSQTRWGNSVVLPVHDELDAFVPAEDAEEATRELVRCMATELYGVKIIADPSEPSFAWQDSV